MQLQIPKKFSGLFKAKKRFKIYYGGRGGAKSHNLARALLAIGATKKIRVLCARSVQKSITDSVHKLLSDIIAEYDSNNFYEVLKSTIVGKNGTEFIFKGLHHNTKEAVKSAEGIDYCWVEEADTITDTEWELLIPSIRKENSEIWVSFNPDQPSDPVYQRFVANPDSDMLIQEVSYLDNPFFPDVLEKERLRDMKRDYKAYEHIWLGKFDERLDGYVFANNIKEAREAGRITKAPHKVGVPVVTAWDLGKTHLTAIWFAQRVGLEVRVIDYYECSGDDADLAKIAQYMRSKPYEYDMHYLPHDARHSRLGMQGSISEQLQSMGIANQILPSNTIASGIQKAKTLLSECYIDSEKCKNGLHAMSKYHYKWNEKKNKFEDTPFDDWSADASDAFRYLALALDKTEQKRKPIDINNLSGGSGGWCG